MKNFQQTPKQRKKLFQSQKLKQSQNRPTERLGVTGRMELLNTKQTAAGHRGTETSYSYYHYY